jgi:hypothetical protein
MNEPANPHPSIRVLRNPDCSLDEILAAGCDVHLEQMDEGTWWLAIERDGERQMVWFRGRRQGRDRAGVAPLIAGLLAPVRGRSFPSQLSKKGGPTVRSLF